MQVKPAPSTKPPTTRHFLSLDGLRGVAALAILASHAPDETIANLLPVRYLGVDFFFLLSGFVLSHAYAERLSSGMGVMEFMTRRYIRLWPLYLLGSCAGLALALRDHWPAASVAASVLCALLFLPMPIPGLSPNLHPAFPLDSPAWSLFFELVVNLVFAAVARFLTGPVLGLLLWAAAGLLMATKLHYGELNVGSTLEGFPGGFGRVLWSFFAGVAVYRLWRLRPAPALPPLVFVPMLLAMLAIDLEMVWVLAGFPLLVYLAASAEPRGWLAPVFAKLGVASYGLYAIHLPIIQILERKLPLGGPLATVALGVVLVFVVLGLDRWFDQPARRWLGRLLLRPPVVARAPA